MKPHENDDVLTLDPMSEPVDMDSLPSALRATLEEAIRQADAGELVDDEEVHEEVMRWFESQR